MGGWGSVTEASQDLDPGVTHIVEKATLFSEWQVRNLAGKSESLGRKTLFGINKLPCHKAPPTLTASIFSLYLDICFLSPFLFHPIHGLCISVSACMHLWAGNPSLFLTSSRLPTLDTILSLA